MKKDRKIDVDVLREFHCSLCGVITPFSERHQGEYCFDNGSVLSTHPERVFLKYMCPECWQELEKAKAQAEEEPT